MRARSRPAAMNGTLYSRRNSTTRRPEKPLAPYTTTGRLSAIVPLLLVVMRARLGVLGERLQGARLDERVARGDLRDLRSREDALDRDLELLPRQRARDRGNRDDRVRRVPRRERRAQRPLDARLELGGELEARTQHDEEQELVLPLEVDDEAVEHLVELLDDRVELARAEPDAAAVERRVRAAGDDGAAVLREPDPVAEAPDPREVLEVRLAVAGAVGVVPEGDRHRRHRLLEDELAELADDGLPVRPERVRVDAEHACRHLAGVDGEQRVALHDPGAHVRAPAAHVQVDVRADLPAEP